MALMSAGRNRQNYRAAMLMASSYLLPGRRGRSAWRWKYMPTYMAVAMPSRRRRALAPNGGEWRRMSPGSRYLGVAIFCASGAARRRASSGERLIAAALIIARRSLA